MVFVNESLNTKEVAGEELIICLIIFLVILTASQLFNFHIGNLTLLIGLNLIMLLTANQFSRIILFAKKENLPPFVRSLKSRGFWFVVLLIGFFWALPMAICSEEKVFEVIYAILSADFLTILLAITWKEIYNTPYWH